MVRHFLLAVGLVSMLSVARANVFFDYDMDEDGFLSISEAILIDGLDFDRADHDGDLVLSEDEFNDAVIEQGLTEYEDSEFTDGLEEEPSVSSELGSTEEY